MAERIRYELTAINKTKQAFSGVQRGLGKMKAAVVNVRTAFGALLAAAAIRSFVKGIQTAVDSLDLIAKTAGKIGITTDALQELQVAADLAGVSAGVLDKSLLRFTRSISESRQGVLEYKEVFDRLGISMKDKQGRFKGLEGLLGEVSDKFAGMTDELEITAAALDLFGQRGAAMVNLLKGGSASLNRFRADARALGVVIDADLIAKTVIAKDQMTLLSRVIDTKVTIAFANMAPQLVLLVGLLADMAQGIANTVTMWRELLGLPIAGREAEFVGNQLEAIRANIAGLEQQKKNLQEVLAVPLNPMLAAVQGTSRENTRDALRAVTDALKTLNVELDETRTKFLDLLQPPKLPGVDLPQLPQLSGLGAVRSALPKLAPIIDPKTTGLTEVTRQAEVLNETFSRDLVPGISSVEDAFVTLATTGKVSFSSLANSILADFIRMETRMLSSKLFGGGSSGGGGLIGNLLGDAFGGALRRAFGGSTAPALSPIPVPRPLVHGGPVRGGEPIKVHAGEVFIPPINGRILNASQAERMGRGGGGRTTIVVNNYGPDNVEVNETGGLTGDQLVEIVIGAVRTDFARGGFDGAMRNRFARVPRLINR